MNEASKAKWSLTGYFGAIALGVALVNGMCSYLSEGLRKDLRDNPHAEQRQKTTIDNEIRKQFHTQAQENLKNCEALLKAWKNDVSSDFKCQADINVDVAKARIAADAWLVKEEKESERMLSLFPKINLALSLLCIAAGLGVFSRGIVGSVRKIRSPA